MSRWISENTFPSSVVKISEKNLKLKKRQAAKKAKQFRNIFLKKLQIAKVKLPGKK